MKTEKTFTERAQSVFESACFAIKEFVNCHDGSFTIPHEDSFEVTIQSSCNGVYPTLLAHISSEGFTCVEESAFYQQDYDFEEDSKGIVACYEMDNSEIARIDICRIANYLCPNCHYYEQYNDILTEAAALIAKIPEGVLIELNGCNSDYLDENWDFVYCKFIAIGNKYAVTDLGEQVDWSHFVSEDYLSLVDALATSIRRGLDN